MYREIGERIKSVRTKNKDTVEQLANKLGVTKGYISLIETGKRKISIELLQNICEVYDIHISYFFPAPQEEKISEDERALIYYHRDLKEEGITTNDIRTWIELARNIKNQEK